MANFCGVVLSNFLSIVIRVFHLVLSCKWAVEIVMPALECSPGKVWWDVWIQLQDRGLESHIGSMGFWYRVYKSPTTTASFYHVVLPSFLSYVVYLQVELNSVVVIGGSKGLPYSSNVLRKYCLVPLLRNIMKPWYN